MLVLKDCLTFQRARDFCKIVLQGDRSPVYWVIEAIGH